MWALSTSFRASRAASVAAVRSVASSLPRQQQLEGLPIQEPVMSSTQASNETQAEVEREPEAQQAGEVVASGEDMLAQEAEASSSSSSEPSRQRQPRVVKGEGSLWQNRWQREKTKRQIYDSMKEQGSYQTDSTWQPTEAAAKPPSAHDVTVSHLMAASAHLGHNPNLTQAAYHPYLAGRRGGVDIINLSHTLPSLRKACGVIRDISRDDGVIVFMGRRHLTKGPVWKAVGRMPGVGHAVTERWRPGSLTNAASVFGSEYVLNGSYLPDLVVVADPRGMINVINECNLKNVPTMGIVDSDVDPRIVTFPIYANCESSRSLELIFGALGRAGEEGIAARGGLQPGSNLRVPAGGYQAKIDNKRDPDVVAYSDEQDPLWRDMRGLRDAEIRGGDRPETERRRASGNVGGQRRN